MQQQVILFLSILVSPENSRIQKNFQTQQESMNLSQNTTDSIKYMLILWQENLATTEL